MGKVRREFILILVLLLLAVFFLDAGREAVTGEPVLKPGTIIVDDLPAGIYTTGQPVPQPSPPSSLVGGSGVTVPSDLKQDGPQPLGMNWVKMEDWSVGAGCFLNLRHAARHFPDSVAKDSDQWPLSPARSYFFQGVADYPAGPYVIKAWGTGTLKFTGDITTTLTVTTVPQQSPQRFIVQGTPSSNGFYLDVTPNANDPVKFDIIPQQYEEDYYIKGKRFYPPCLQKLSKVNTLRFMDAFGTNGDKDSDWSKRSLPSWYSYAADGSTSPNKPGLPYELAFQLVREARTNMWLNIPHKADDNFLNQLAQLAARELQPEAKMYVEVSNELWNGGFVQGREATALAAQAGLATTSGTSCSAGAWAGSQCWQAYRLAKFMDYATAAFGSTVTRVKPTLAGQLSNSGLLSIAMNIWGQNRYNPQGHQVSAYAVNAYCCDDVGQNICSAGQANSATVQTIIAHSLADVTTMGPLIASDKATATRKGIPELVAYEGGQHLTPGSCSNNQQFVNTLAAANRDQGMEQVYDVLFNTWKQNGGETFIVYNALNKYDKNGYWGIWEHVNEGTTAKARSVLKRI